MYGGVCASVCDCVCRALADISGSATVRMTDKERERRERADRHVKLSERGAILASDENISCSGAQFKFQIGNRTINAVKVHCTHCGLFFAIIQNESVEMCQPFLKKVL